MEGAEPHALFVCALYIQFFANSIDNAKMLLYNANTDYIRAKSDYNDHCAENDVVKGE